MPIFVDSRFFGFPLSTPHPLTTAKTNRRNKYLQTAVLTGISTFERLWGFPYNGAENKGGR